MCVSSAPMLLTLFWKGHIKVTIAGKDIKVTIAVFISWTINYVFNIHWSRVSYYEPLQCSPHAASTSCSKTCSLVPFLLGSEIAVWAFYEPETSDLAYLALLQLELFFNDKCCPIKNLLLMIWATFLYQKQKSLMWYSSV